MRKAIYLSAQAWRQAYGQLATQDPQENAFALQYQLPGGQAVILDGWREEKRGDESVFVGPNPGNPLLGLPLTACYLDNPLLGATRG